MTTIRLKGMTWDHPRGYDPMVACSRLWKERTGVEIEWDRRSLQDFESFPVEELARRYDLIVIDHPHVGQITNEGCLRPLDIPGREAELDALARQSVGQSFPSYTWRGHQWAFPIDAATQVQAWRPDQIDAPVTQWRDLLPLAKRGRVQCPMRPPHSLMTFYTLAGNLGAPCAVEGPDLVDPAVGAETYELIRELVSHLDPACFEMDPIAVFERMVPPDSTIAVVPLIYGYVSYALDGFRPRRVRFSDIPTIGAAGPVGSALGGTGIAVSARGDHQDDATAFAYWVASAEIQRGPYAAAGGQPGNAVAWRDTQVNQPVAGFYADTQRTLDGAWVRPRHDGYMPFQQRAADRLNEALRSGESAASFVADFNALFRASLKP
ncbi:ABC transporter substrate-binding protein [Skermanella stibiiresistens]|nr:ABC transporter substrate-binding protein [Skermanella stibiiresistens]